jgi:hypothetical protein
MKYLLLVQRLRGYRGKKLRGVEPAQNAESATGASDDCSAVHISKPLPTDFRLGSVKTTPKIEAMVPTTEDTGQNFSSFAAS